MVFAWCFTSVVFLIVWLTVSFFLAISVAEKIQEGNLPDTEITELIHLAVAGSFFFFVFSLFHWIIILLAVPVFVCYGLYCTVRVAVSIWKSE